MFMSRDSRITLLSYIIPKDSRTIYILLQYTILFSYLVSMVEGNDCIYQCVLCSLKACPHCTQNAHRNLYLKECKFVVPTYSLNF